MYASREPFVEMPLDIDPKTGRPFKPLRVDPLTGYPTEEMLLEAIDNLPPEEPITGKPITLKPKTDKPNSKSSVTSKKITSVSVTTKSTTTSAKPVYTEYNCGFPFKSDGVVYNKCAYSKVYNKFWCYTKGMGTSAWHFCYVKTKKKQ